MLISEFVVCVLGWFYDVIQTVLEYEVSCNEQQKKAAINKTSVAALMPYVSPEVTFAYCHSKICFLVIICAVNDFEMLTNK